MMRSANVYVHYGTDVGAMARTLLDTAQARKALSDRPIVLKPNLVVAQSSSQGATTSPALAEAVLVWLHDIGRRDIVIAESSWLGQDTRTAFEACGYAALARRYGAKLVDLKRDETARVTVDGESVEICRTALEGCLINMPVLKAHSQTTLTCAIKNLKGCIPDREKRRYHAQGLMRPIALLGTALASSVAFTLVDALCGDLSFEEGGTPVRMDTLMLGEDLCAVDAQAARMLGYAPEEIEYLSMATRLGAGRSAFEVVSLSEPPEGRHESVKADRTALELIRAHIHEDGACSACLSALVRALYRLRREGSTIPGGIQIGQGWKSRRGAQDGIGIGRCCAHCGAHVPGCPPDAETIVRFLRDKVLASPGK